MPRQAEIKWFDLVNHLCEVLNDGPRLPGLVNSKGLQAPFQFKSALACYWVSGLGSQYTLPRRLARTQLVELKHKIRNDWLLTSGSSFISVVMESAQFKSEEKC